MNKHLIKVLIKVSKISINLGKVGILIGLFGLLFLIVSNILPLIDGTITFKKIAGLNALIIIIILSIGLIIFAYSMLNYVLKQFNLPILKTKRLNIISQSFVEYTKLNKISQNNFINNKDINYFIIKEIPILNNFKKQRILYISALGEENLENKIFNKIFEYTNLPDFAKEGSISFNFIFKINITLFSNKLETLIGLAEIDHIIIDNIDLMINSDDINQILKIYQLFDQVDGKVKVTIIDQNRNKQKEVEKLIV